MIDSVFKNLMEQPGIHASMVLNAAGQLIAHRGDALYDQALLESVSASLSRALDSVDLLHADWDELQVQYGDGMLMLRDLGSLPQGGRATLAVVADTSLNRSFATVAMRVVVQKLKQALAGGGDLSQLAATSSSSMLGELPAGAAASLTPGQAHQPPLGGASHNGFSHPAGTSGYNAAQPGGGSQLGGAPAPRLDPTNPFRGPNQSAVGSGLAWSGVENNRSSGLGVAVADDESLQLLSTVAKNMAPFVGPMAKVFVKEAVLRVCQDVPFSRERLPAVLKALESQIEDPSDCQQFRYSIRSVV